MGSPLSNGLYSLLVALFPAKHLTENPPCSLAVFVGSFTVRHGRKIHPVGHTMFMEKHKVHLIPAKLIGHHILHEWFHCKKQELDRILVLESIRELLPHEVSLVFPCRHTVGKRALPCI
ncbi:hypothetical protein SDC9_185024 [bioreactor metagenome]|uniref:Uncharacterized protein n=1 Tax=bioreactor metagenome TaxID=1076179 RepID=A0A645HEP4_9ZZZZ